MLQRLRALQEWKCAFETGNSLSSQTSETIAKPVESMKGRNAVQCSLNGCCLGVVFCINEVTCSGGKVDYNTKLFQNSATTHCRRVETAESAELHQSAPAERGSRNNCSEDPFPKARDTRTVEHNTLWGLSTSVSAISMIMFIFNSPMFENKCFGMKEMWLISTGNKTQEGIQVAMKKV